MSTHGSPGGSSGDGGESNADLNVDDVDLDEQSPANPLKRTCSTLSYSDLNPLIQIDDDSEPEKGKTEKAKTQTLKTPETKPDMMSSLNQTASKRKIEVETPDPCLSKKYEMYEMSEFAPKNRKTAIVTNGFRKTLPIASEPCSSQVQEDTQSQSLSLDYDMDELESQIE